MCPFSHIQFRQLSFEKDNGVRLWKPFAVIELGKMTIVTSYQTLRKESYIILLPLSLMVIFFEKKNLP